MLNKICSIVHTHFTLLSIMTKYYYAVGRGRKVGVFETWSECKQQVVKIGNAQFRKFDSKEKAWAFVRECQAKYSPYKSPEKNQLSQTQPVRSSSPSLLSPSTITVPSYTRGLDSVLCNPGTSTANASSSANLGNKFISNSQVSVIPPETSEDGEVTQSLQKRLKNVEKHHEEVSQQIVLELQEVKTKCEALSETEKSLSNIIGEIKCVLDKLSKLETQFKVSQFKMKAEINKLNADILSLKIENGKQLTNVGSSSSCRKNLSQFLTAAAVPVPIGQKRNCSEPVQGRATNNTAEIQAAVHAIEIAKRAGVKKILINTDSKFLISCITQWIHKWKKNNWTLINGGSVKNKEDLVNLDEAMKGISVKWNHVRGHQGIHGNEMADKLARAGADRYGMSQSF
ncbi:ribonuclease H1 isoform X2 [Anabrus simplex]|uniref:ribonuclease H1 isoform X2 n=1 Tax=Anabrus simplex TaxID=316456 RepID=UPI0035A2D87F